ncbi:MAG: hypothetical protein PUH90_06680, partial [Clostridia bacterium]|nr:hypothetical protein [Clostridia bacterium]
SYTSQKYRDYSFFHILRHKNFNISVEKRQRFIQTSMTEIISSTLSAQTFLSHSVTIAVSRLYNDARYG